VGDAVTRCYREWRSKTTTPCLPPSSVPVRCHLTTVEDGSRLSLGKGLNGHAVLSGSRRADYTGSTTAGQEHACMGASTQDQGWRNKPDLRSKYSKVKAKAEEQDEAPQPGAPTAQCVVILRRDQTKQSARE
jgi:hypothetical protein